MIKTNIFSATPYDFLYSFKSAGIETRQMVRNTSLVVPSFSAQLGAIIARHPLPTTISAVVLHNCHGAGTRRDPTAAFGNRDQHILVGFASQCDWTDEESKTLVSKWPVEVHDELVEAGLSTGWKYVNFNPPETGDGKMYLGQEGVKSMRKIKERWDPKGVFALNTPDLSE